jgi:ribosomal-protein-alanine N-acetyltransferase
MFFIETERLKLIPLVHDQLLLLQQSRLLMEQSIALEPSDMKIDDLYLFEFDDALRNFWLPNTKLYPEKYEWYTNWEIIDKESNCSIGGLGFAGYPDEHGETMIGYYIDQKQHRKGYGTEALAAITKWLFKCDDLLLLKIETGANNYPSQKIAVKCGFSQSATNGNNLIFELKKP